MELYVHIPFCRKKCAYCDFASFAGREDDMEAYIQALLTEARMRYDGQCSVETVFIGGGTPSVLPPPLLEKLLSGLREIFSLQPGIEFTSEANPGTLTRTWLATARSFGVNRLSMGAQAAQESLLRMLGRIHTWKDVVSSFELARDCGFSNLSLDLMFGLPGQSVDMWEETLDKALELKPYHLSCYGLIPEEGTVLYRKLETAELSLPEEEEEREMYDKAVRTLSENGFEQYEISNFAKPGYACRHNLGYWRQVPYLGLGVSAASMLMEKNRDGYERTANTPDLTEYMHSIRETGSAVTERTYISPEEARFETLMLGLRTTQGVSEEAFRKMHGVELESYRGPELKRQEKLGNLMHVQGFWRLTRRGMDIQNSVLVDLMDQTD